MTAPARLAPHEASAAALPASASLHLAVILGLALLILICIKTMPAFGQDRSPLKDFHVWQPMTGYTDQQVADARAAGFDTILLKIHPEIKTEPLAVDFESTDQQVTQLSEAGFKVVMAILGWASLGANADGVIPPDGSAGFWDTRENGEKVPGRLDPFWPEAMDRVEWYYRECFRHYRDHPNVVAFVPTWGIYGEAGFTSYDAGRSPHALARFNQWRQQQDLPPAAAIPNLSGGPNTEYNRFILFRYQYVQSAFNDMLARLRPEAGGRIVGMWQELYPVVGYLWNMVRIPNADFALYESCFTFQTSHDQHSTLAETMGFRYRCLSAEQYQDYYLPLLARKRGEGQRFMGCQLSNHYAVQYYGWSEERTERVEFDRWEDLFSPTLKKLLDKPLESPERDVLLVFPSYAAAALSDSQRHGVDAFLLDTLLRMYGCQIQRIGSPELDAMTLEEMNQYRLIVVPEASFIFEGTWRKLRSSTAHVLLTGEVAQALNGEMTPAEDTREFDGMNITYGNRPAGEVSMDSVTALTRNLPMEIEGKPLALPEDESFNFAGPGADVLLSCEGWPLVSLHNGETLMLHGHIFASACHNPRRKAPRNTGGSADPSANEMDIYGPHDAADPRNAFTTALMKNILDWAGADYRLPNPKPRTITRYLGDHMEQVYISANLVYNNTGRRQTVTVRTPYAVQGMNSRRTGGRYETKVTVPAYSYKTLQPEKPEHQTPIGKHLHCRLTTCHPERKSRDLKRNR